MLPEEARAPVRDLKSPPFNMPASSIDETCELLRQHGDGAKLIAGGQSLFP
jgi:hypothetical protein